MAEAVVKCRCCGSELLFAAEESVLRCGFCRTVNVRPRAVGDTLNIFNLATEQRLAKDFCHAEQSYLRVLEIQKDEYEAHWGLVLSKYGVEYIMDERAGRQRPVCHSVRVRPMREDPHYKRACALAPEDVRAAYEADAAYIDAAQRRIRQLQQDDPGYDIFLCYKHTAMHSNEPTEERGIAHRLYNDLSLKGYRVFYAPESLAELVGENYEAGIYHAIETAKVMLVIGCRADHLMSGWVQSEWGRYLERMEDGEDKHLVPIYGGMQARDLPEAFKNWGLQGLSMDRLMWREELQSALLRVMPPPQPEPEAPSLPEDWDDYLAWKKRQDAVPAAPEVEPEPIPIPPAPAAPEAPPVPAAPEVEPEPIPIPSAPAVPEAPPVPAAPEAPPAPAAPVPEPIPVPSAPTAPEPTSYTPEHDFEIALWQGGVRIKKYNGSFKDVHVPPKFGALDVLCVDGFANNDRLTSVTIPEGVRELGRDYMTISCGFQKCGHLKRVSLPASLEVIQYSTFEDCVSLTDIGLPEGLKSIGPEAFKGCVGLTDIRIPEGITSIAYGTFQGCTGLTRIRIPDGVTGLWSSAFADCTGLTDVVLPEGVTRIDNWAFSRCTRLTELRLPGTVTVLGNGAFSACTALRRMVLPDGLASIEPTLFYGCSGLTNVRIPDSVTAIGHSAFAHCTGLTEVRIPGRVASIDSRAFEGCRGLTHVRIPDSVTTIGAKAFDEGVTIRCRRGSYADKWANAWTRRGKYPVEYI